MLDAFFVLGLLSAHLERFSSLVYEGFKKRLSPIPIVEAGRGWAQLLIMDLGMKGRKRT